MRTLDGVRVLIAEDNFIVADSLKRLITAYGGTVAVMVPSADAALAALESVPIDVAILDIYLKGGTADPLADRLLESRIPFLFLTGYGDDNVLPERLRGLPRLEKPLDVDQLLETLASLLGKN
jgi:CheY-like chemotaxis protein